MITLALLAASYVGMLCHWYKKVFRQETSCGPFDYIKAYPKHTISAFATTTGAVIALIATGVVMSEQTIAAAFTIGFSLDSLINKAPEDK